jgi:hypothetical protein
METIIIGEEILVLLQKAVDAAYEFELKSGKQLNITSMVGEVYAAQKFELKLVKDDINPDYDAIDRDGKLVQIKARRYKGNKTAMTGPLLNKEFKVAFDYALLVLLNLDYSLKEIFRIEKDWVETHFERINKDRTLIGKKPRKTMSISQFERLPLYKGNKKDNSSKKTP